MPLIDAIAAQTEALTALRHDIHAHPELGFEEHRTGKLVADKLTEWGIETHTGIARTGVVGVIRGKGNGPASIGLRADLDCLPMDEAGTPPYRSTHDGRMHACGHDGHTVMLLGAAQYLAEARNFDGVVNVIFQPAEENAGGGRVMVEEGLFDRFPCDAVYGMHNYTGLAKGTFGINAGGFMAASDVVEFTIGGIGGHAAWPDLTVDPVAIGAQLHGLLQTVVSRNVKPTSPAVVSVTQFHAGTAENVIPGTAKLVASVRSLDEETRALLERRIGEICDGLAAAHGASIDVAYRHGYPVLVNHADQTARAAEAARLTVGDDNVNDKQTPILGSEDFAYMLQARPGAYILLGQGDETCVHPLHHPEYDFNDAVLATGASYWAHLAEQELPL